MQVLPPNKEKEAILSARLLIADADAYLRAVIRQQLLIEGFSNIFEIGTAADFDTDVINSNPDLIVLEMQIQERNAIEICQSLRGNGFAKPILLLAAKGLEDDIVLGLDAGANDYIVKPLRLGELLACIRMQLRQFFVSDDVKFQIGNLIFVPANKTLYESANHKAQTLTDKESAILRFLYQAFPNEVTKSQILSEVWGLRKDVSTHTLETHIYRLRQKISQLNKKQLVLTTEKGYRLVY